MKAMIELPDWAVVNPTAFRQCAARVTAFVRPDYPSMVMLPRCAHGYNPFTDTCPSCAGEDDRD